MVLILAYKLYVKLFNSLSLLFKLELSYQGRYYDFLYKFYHMVFIHDQQQVHSQCNISKLEYFQFMFMVKGVIRICFIIKS